MASGLQIDLNNQDWETELDDIGAALDDADIGMVYDNSGTAWVRFAWSRVKTYIQALTDTLYVALTGDQSVAGIKTFSSFPVTPSSAPTTDYQVANKKYVDDNAGGGGLTANSQTITTSNLSCAAGYAYNCTIAGLTANRNAVLPTPSAAGEQIRINILDGDATYSLIIIGDTGVTINGGSAATEWSRLFIQGESVTLESTSTSNWNVITDRRIPCSMEIENNDDQSFSSKTDTQVVLDESVSDNASVSDTSNYRFNCRRTNKYNFVMGLRWDVFLDAADFSGYIKKDGSTVPLIMAATATVNLRPTPIIAGSLVFEAGSYYEYWARQNTNSSVGTWNTSGQRQFMSLIETFND